MADGINSCSFIGNLGADPELRTTRGRGEPVLNFRIAVGTSYVDANRQRQERTEWIPIVAWGKFAEMLASMLCKGTHVYVEGEMRTSSYEKTPGDKRYKTEIVANTVRILNGGRDRTDGDGERG